MILYSGLGRMGLPMATHALRAGQGVVGVDPSPERRALFTAAGGRAVESLADVSRDIRAVVVMVGAQNQVVAIIDDLIAAGAREALVLVVSTVSPRFIAELGLRAREHGLRLVDAPVCRAETGAIAGNLLAFLSGDPADCQEAAALMAPYTADLEVVGARLGAAQVAKTVNNMILWACAIANEEALGLAEGWDLDVAALRRALVTSSADNWCLRNWDRIDQMPWSIKDMEIALETARDAGAEVPLGAVVEQLVRRSALLTHAG